MSERDIKPASEVEATRGPSGRSVIAAIGIDRYKGWRRLTNAVSDARGALKLFGQLGYEQVTGPLLDDAATGKAVQELVMDDLRTLGPEDRLVLFYAGHGGTRTDRPAGQEVKTGYLIPVDATDRAATWIELDGWLRAVAKLPAKHILVILDACHSGIALGPIIKWRDTGTWQGTPLSTLQARRSRRIITSALDDQVALDSGPVHGHSLFTGCLIEGLTHGLGGGNRRVTTGSELGLYVQRRVETYPNSRQTPDFGTFDFDERGELVIPLVSARSEEPAGSRRPPDPVPKAMPPVPNARPPVPKAMPPVPKAKPSTVSAVKPAPPVAPAPADPEADTANPAAALGSKPPAANSASGPAVFAREVFLAGRPAVRPADPVARGAPVPGGGSASSVAPPPPEVAAAPWSLVPSAGPAVPQVSSKAGGHGLRRWVFLGGGTALAFTLALVAYSAFGEAPSAHPERPPDCPNGMVRVSGGTFQMGSPDGVGDADERPRHAVMLSGYCIDQTEVTVGAYAACVAAKACAAAPLTVQWSGYSEADVKKWSRFCNKGDRQYHPMNCVDWNQAGAYCKWAGKRLPTEAEWEYAARHDSKTGKDRTYPWGEEAPSAKRLNACGSECVAMAKRDLKESWAAMYEGSDGWESTAPVGRFPGGASPVGALGMAGNVWEWMEDWYGDYPAALLMNPPGAKSGTYRVARGGGWSDDDASRVRGAVRLTLGPSDRHSIVGFRCARGD